MQELVSDRETSESDSYNHSVCAETDNNTSEYDGVEEKWGEDNFFLNFITFLRYKKIICIIIFLGFIATLSHRKSLEFENIPDGTIVVNMSRVFWTLVLGLSLQIAVSHVLYYSTKILLNFFTLQSNIIFCINNMAIYFSAILVTSSALVYVKLIKLNFYIKKDPLFEIQFISIVMMSLLVSILSAISKMIILNIMKSLNYNLFLDRIKINIYEHTYIYCLSSANKSKAGQFNLDAWKNTKRISWNIIMAAANPKSEAREADGRSILNEFKSIMLAIPSPQAHSKRFHKMVNKKTKNIFNGTKGMKYRDLGCCGPTPDHFFSLIRLLKYDTESFISRDDLFSMIEKTYRDYYHLKTSLEQMFAASKRLLAILYVVSSLIGLIFIVIRGSNDLKIPTAFFSSLVGVSILFQKSFITTVDCIIFLFVIHPYDLGDRVNIKIDNAVENMVVSELNILSTKFYRWDGVLIYIPNALLLGKAIANIDRSEQHYDQVRIQISSHTEKCRIYSFEKMLKTYINSKPLIYSDFIKIFYEQIEDSNKLHLAIIIKYKTGWKSHEAYLGGRGDLIDTINEYLIKCDIGFTLSPQKVNIFGNLPQVCV